MIQCPLQDPLRDGETLLGSSRDALVVQRQADDSCPIFFHQRQDLIHYLLFPVDRVDDRLAVIHPQGRFDGCRIRRVDLKRQVRDRLHLLDHLRHHRHFIEPGNAYVDVQNLRSRVDLVDRLVEQIIEVPIQQRLLHPFLAGRVEPLPDHRHMIDRDGPAPAGDLKRRDVFRACYVLRRSNILDPVAKTGNLRFGPIPACHIAEFLPLIVFLYLLRKPSDVFRAGPAASADHIHSRFDERLHGSGEVFFCDVVFSGGRVRQSRVRLGKHRQTRIALQLPDHRIDLVRSERAVDTHGVDPESFELQSHRLKARPCERPPTLIKGHGNDHRQITVFFRSKNGRFRFIKVGHGLDHD